ncbi:FAD-binding domain containing protein [Grosmannia clavigera kw1407]|uniref:FAD synthase n=1 Tax=Grosmannia clavigera (strain kw1407 / UAMH 11150) TaxID=655863 RepID=F0XNZ4_GROCL|nr:FAD-binding domain containing protein [Grosmannia clavigera kw1407]EFX00716.1 FAD-binding domain containing protein [Grosmannia clavigera kw1407]
MPPDWDPLHNNSGGDRSGDSSSPVSGVASQPSGHVAAANGINSGGLLSELASPRCQVPELPDVCHQLRRKLLAFLEERPNGKTLQTVQVQMRVSMGVIDEALRRYALDELALSYNGGKDCLVLLILILACLPVRTSSPKANGRPSDTAEPDADATAAATSTATEAQTVARFQAIYIVPPDPFPEVDAFVETSTKQYHLDLARYALPMRAALDAYLGDHKTVRAIFMGTRRTDPHSEFLTQFTPTDAGWPQFMRVNPVLDWHYAEIWAFIRHLDIPFCNLYNKGFTSLGGTTDTRPNPVLATNGATDTFRPAYELVADDEERLGRGR